MARAELRPRLFARRTELAFASNITGDWVIYRQRIADGRSWRVTFGPGPARNPDYRPAS
jgi:hypothetical protein